MNKTNRKSLVWIIWGVLSIALAGYLFAAINNTEGTGIVDASAFLPNNTTSGHHQIELACTSCHVEAFGGKELIQNACVGCHEKEFERIDDSHPKKKFTDPRNADTLKSIDARYCMSCHVEHKPDMTNTMGVTQPDNVCYLCHQDVGENRPTHKDLAFTTCGNSGCHNFHDNKALYEDFLVRHMDKPKHLAKQKLEIRDLITASYMNPNYPKDEYPLAPLSAEQADAPETYAGEDDIHKDWLNTKHAKAGVNCTACHEQADPETKLKAWVEKPDHTSCQTCHADETTGFMEGKHGMRLKVGLSPMTPAMARLPMNPANKHEELTCVSCHGAHTFDTQKAAKESCQQCHVDDHSVNFDNSPHAELWQAELDGIADEGTGVNCSTCHMPRIWHEDDNGNERILVDHNQNNTLRPNDKMLRPVCMNCHGLGFAMDALADPEMIKNNFSGESNVHVESIDMAREVDRIFREKKAARKAAREAREAKEALEAEEMKKNNTE